MKLTNNFNAEPELVRAYEVFRSRYDRGNSDFTATELLKPARQRQLQIKHKDELQEDLRSVFWSMFGSAMHLVAEMGASKDSIIEARYFAKFGEYTVSAQIDNYNTVTKELKDWKTTKVYGFKKNVKAKEEYVQQLNIQNELLNRNNIWPEKLSIVGILKDWDEEASKKDANYPIAPWGKLGIPMWPRQKTITFINERIRIHLEAEKELPLCTPKETWYGRRCGKWCNVHSMCDQYQTALKTGKIINE